MYREDPSRRLTFSEVRSRLQGDVSGLHRWVWITVLMFVTRVRGSASKSTCFYGVYCVLPKPLPQRKASAS